MYSPREGEGRAQAILVPMLWFLLSHQLGNQSRMLVSLSNQAGMKSGLCAIPALSLCGPRLGICLVLPCFMTRSAFAKFPLLIN